MISTLHWTSTRAIFLARYVYTLSKRISYAAPFQHMPSSQRSKSMTRRKSSAITAENIKAISQKSRISRLRQQIRSMSYFRFATAFAVKVLKPCSLRFSAAAILSWWSLPDGCSPSGQKVLSTIPFLVRHIASYSLFILSLHTRSSYPLFIHSLHTLSLRLPVIVYMLHIMHLRRINPEPNAVVKLLVPIPALEPGTPVDNAESSPLPLQSLSPKPSLVD